MLFSNCSSPNPSLEQFESFLVVVGLIAFGKVGLSTVWDILVGFRSMFWARLWKKNFGKRYGGKWAVITGSTDGIGKAYAHEMAADGLNILLISRSLDKLNKVAREIESQHGVQTAVVQADFSESDDVLYPMIEPHLAKKDIAILVNNVGIMWTPRPSDEVNKEQTSAMVNINVSSVVHMTRLVLPQMISRKKGAIVNISSIVSLGPIPLQAMYAASKAFVDFYSVALQWDMARHNITVQTVYPGFVATNLINYSKWLRTTNIFTPDATTFARWAVPTIGYTSSTSGYWSHGIQTWFMRFLVRWPYIMSMDLLHRFLRSSNDHSN